MKRSFIIKTSTNRKHVSFPRSLEPDGLAFEELFQDISQDWEQKAQRLLARRWRKIKHKLA